jgi:hypothetical protein
MKKIVFICDKCKEDITEWVGNKRMYVGVPSNPATSCEFDLCERCTSLVKAYASGDYSVIVGAPAVGWIGSPTGECNTK